MTPQTSLVCERREGLATIVACSACTCFQEILTKLDENGQQIDEVKAEVIENGENIQQIIDEIPGGEKYQPGKRYLQHCQFDRFLVKSYFFTSETTEHTAI